MIKPQKIPYAYTKVNFSKTKAQIDELLYSKGITKTAWNIDKDKNFIQLNFEVETEFNGQVKTFFFKIEPPVFIAGHNSYDKELGRGVRITAPNLAASMRLLHDYVKVKLSAVAFGMVAVEKEFLAQVVVKGHDGRSTTIGEAIEPILQSGNLSLPSGNEVKENRVIDVN